MPRRNGAIDERPSASSNSGPSPITSHEKNQQMFFLSVCVAEDPANRTREEKKRFRSKQTASKQGTNHSDSYSRRIDLPAATRLPGKPGLLHTSHSTERGALFRHFCVSKVITTAHAHRMVSFLFFPRAFKQKKIKMPFKKKIKALRPKMTKLASRGSLYISVLKFAGFLKRNKMKKKNCKTSLQNWKH